MDEQVGLMSLWDRVTAFLRQDLHVVLPVAGAFFFLPTVILTRFLPATATIGEFSPAMLPPMLLILLLQTIGQLVIFILVLDMRKPTVANAMRLAFRRLLPAVGAQFMLLAMICGLLVAAQLLVMLFGGSAMMSASAGTDGAMQMAAIGIAIASPAILYLLARFSVAFPALVTAPLTPLEAMRRAFGLTRGQGWRIAALFVVAGLFYLFVQLALGAAFGGIAMLIGKLLGMEMLATLMILLFTALVGTIATLIITVAISFLYSDLAQESSGLR